MSEDKIYEVRESRIRTLAEKCPDYKTAMLILFPDAFPDSPCCASFDRAITEGSIRMGEISWIFGTDWIVKYCPFCGKSLGPLPRRGVNNRR